MSAMLEAYDAVDTVDEQPVLVTRERVDSRVPTQEEDPHHAWYVRTSIRGAAEGPLAGVRLAVKDSVMVAGVPMMNGADLLEGYTPDVDATVVTRALDAGAEIVGKTACEYFCLSGGSHTNAHGPTPQPAPARLVRRWLVQRQRRRGGDGAGGHGPGRRPGRLIRMPASFSGVVGIKPTYSLVPDRDRADRGFFDHVGPMTRTVADNARLLQVIAGPTASTHGSGPCAWGTTPRTSTRGSAACASGYYARASASPVGNRTSTPRSGRPRPSWRSSARSSRRCPFRCTCSARRCGRRSRSKD